MPSFESSSFQLCVLFFKKEIVRPIKERKEKKRKYFLLSLSRHKVKLAVERVLVACMYFNFFFKKH